jgi:hypothetical protein
MRYKILIVTQNISQSAKVHSFIVNRIRDKVTSTTNFNRIDTDDVEIRIFKENQVPRGIRVNKYIYLGNDIEFENTVLKPLVLINTILINSKSVEVGGLYVSDLLGNLPKDEVF